MTDEPEYYLQQLKTLYDAGKKHFDAHAMGYLEDAISEMEWSLNQDEEEVDENAEHRLDSVHFGVGAHR